MGGKRRKRVQGGVLAPGRQGEEGDEGEREKRIVPESLLIRDYDDAVAATPFLPPPI